MATPVATPEDAPIVTIERLSLVHVPPATPSVSDVVRPVQTLVIPVIVVGDVFTVTIALVLHPVDKAYTIVAVPAEAPVIIPVPEPAPATVVLLLLHVPPPLRSLRSVVAPAQTLSVPSIPVGVGSTVTVMVVRQPVGNV